MADKQRTSIQAPGGMPGNLSHKRTADASTASEILALRGATALLFGSMECRQEADSAEEAGRCAIPASSTTGLLSPLGLGAK